MHYLPFSSNICHFTSQIYGCDKSLLCEIVDQPYQTVTIAKKFQITLVPLSFNFLVKQSRFNECFSKIYCVSAAKFKR